MSFYNKEERAIYIHSLGVLELKLKMIYAYLWYEYIHAKDSFGMREKEKKITSDVGCKEELRWQSEKKLGNVCGI